MTIIANVKNFLEKFSPDDILDIGFNNPHSYRGYYQCAAVEPDSFTRVKDMIYVIENLLSQEFTGYKGGTYTYKLDTEIFIASYGCCAIGNENESFKGFFNQSTEMCNKSKFQTKLLEEYSKKLGLSEPMTLGSLIESHAYIKQDYVRLREDANNQFNDTISRVKKWQEDQFKKQFISFDKLRSMTIQEIIDLLG